MIFPHPLGNVYEVSKKLDDFLNFHAKWVNTALLSPNICKENNDDFYFEV